MREAVRSIENLLCRLEFELILVDDGSPNTIDPTSLGAPELLNVEYIRHERNRGAAAARNTGIANAKGKYIAFLDSDDRIIPEVLEKRLALAESDEGYDTTIWGCGWHDTDKDAQWKRTRFPRSAEEVADFFAGCWFSPGSCVLIRRSLLSRTGIQFDEELRRLEDFDFFCRLAMAAPIRLKVLDEVGAKIATGSPRSASDVFRAADRISAKLREEHRAGRLRADLLRKARAYLSYEIAKYRFQERQYGAGAVALAHSLMLAPRLKSYPGPGWRASP